MTEEEQRRACAISIDDTGKAWGYNPAKQPNPAWKGNAKSRFGFQFNPYCHPLGKFLQGTVKGSIQKSVEFAHAGILKYDPGAYEFEDTRLLEIKRVATESINDLFFDELERRTRADGTRKCRLMLKLLDVCLFLMKEDVFYRWRFILLMKRIGQAAEGMEPTPGELGNYKKTRR